MSNTNILNCFWLPAGYVRTTSSGVNAASIIHKATGTSCGNSLDTAALRKRQEQYILAQAEKNRKSREYFTKMSDMPKDFFRITDTATLNAYKPCGGMVFSEEQAIYVCSKLSNPHVSVGRDIFYIYQGSEK